MLDFLRQIGSTLAGWGPFGVLAAAFLDSAGLPLFLGVDALIILIAWRSATAGYLSAGLACGGSLAGALIPFHIGRQAARKFLRKAERRKGIRTAERWFRRYGLMTIFVPALIPLPLPMKIPVLLSGAAGTRRRYFMLTLLAGRAIRYFAMAIVGAYSGPSAIDFLGRHIWWVVGITSASIVLLLLGIWWSRKSG